MVKFIIEQELQALNLFKVGYTRCYATQRHSTQEDQTIIQELKHEHDYQLQKLLHYSKSIFEHHTCSR